MKPYPTEKIRNLVLAGHGGSGKTSVGDAIARLTGLNNRLGSVADGSSIMDHEPEEKDRGGSLSTSFLTCEYDDFKIHIADTPGDGDFIHDAYLAMQAVDGMVLVVSAIDGIETQTEKMSALAEEMSIPRAVLINKLDRDRSSHEGALNEIRDVLGLEPVLLQIPIGQEADFKGVIDLVSKQAYTYSGDSGSPTVGAIPDDMNDAVEMAIEAMTEAVAMTDDELVEQYLEEGTLSSEELRAGLNKGITEGSIIPVVLGSATENIGMDRLLWLTRAFPSPLGRAPAVGHDPKNESVAIEVAPDPDAPFQALCFKSIYDPFAGHLSLFRVLSGGGSNLHPLNSRTGKEERVGALFHLIGKKPEPVDRVTTGDIFAVPKLKDTEAGDTLSDPKHPCALAWREPPAPMISYVIKPKTRADEDKCRGALDKILSEDRGLKQSFDDVTKEIVLSGRGANHVTITCHKMKRKYGVEVDLGTPTIPYRETISGNADVRYRHKKQTGGAGQFGEVSIRLSPNVRGEGFVFADKTVGGVIPNSLIPSVEKGVRAQLDAGVLAGFPIVDVRVELYDGKSHPVDSKDIAFQIAGKQAIKKAMPEARPVLLSPPRPS
ncbi:MAG: elongation factor G, partial [Myxococcota bacterium]|nr:elongation factor G [Myxococcota bacterium]